MSPSDKYLIVIERSQTGFAAYSPDVPGCVATGETFNETVATMREALALHLQAMLEDGEEVPPQGVQSYLDAIHDSEGEEYYLTHVTVASILPDSVSA